MPTASVGEEMSRTQSSFPSPPAAKTVAALPLSLLPDAQWPLADSAGALAHAFWPKGGWGAFLPCVFSKLSGQDLVAISVPVGWRAWAS
jgi:hypothetical protein